MKTIEIIELFDKFEKDECSFDDLKGEVISTMLRLEVALKNMEHLIKNMEVKCQG
jgi:hypothetical protein